MKIVGINEGAGGQPFSISEGDRVWVEENFGWLKSVFGYPNKQEEQTVLTAAFFPATFSTPEVSVENVVTDLCRLFGIPRDYVRYDVLSDLRDHNDIPYQMEGVRFASETELKKGNHRLFVAYNMVKHRDRLVCSLIYEFIRIRLTESDLEFDVGGDDTGLFIYLAGIYYGFGVILVQHLLNTEHNEAARSEIKWNYGSEMPRNVMAFSLATYANLSGDNHPKWKNEFPPDFRKLFEQAVTYLNNNPNDLYDEQEVRANDLFNQANDHFEKNEMDEAIATLQKILFITNDDVMKADVFNNMGYYYLRIKDYKLGISSFRKALALGPEYGFANDNLGYALIMTGELEEGKACIEKALATGNSDLAYSYRNLALYYQKKKDFVLAEHWYQRSLDMKVPVDLLEYHYGEFLMEQGNPEKAKVFFLTSALKSEEEGLSRLQELDARKD